MTLKLLGYCVCFLSLFWYALEDKKQCFRVQCSFICGEIIKKGNYSRYTLYFFIYVELIKLYVFCSSHTSLTLLFLLHVRGKASAVFCVRTCVRKKDTNFRLHKTHLRTPGWRQFVFCSREYEMYYCSFFLLLIFLNFKVLVRIRGKRMASLAFTAFIYLFI